MVKVLIDLLDFLRTSAPLLVSTAILALLFVLLAKSIKKNPGVYYTLFALPFVMVALPSICGWFGLETMSFVRIPVLGEIVRDYIHMGTFGHPLLIIIMYIGALNVRQPAVKRLMLIRKEMSIIVGFAVFAHSLIRVVNSVPSAWGFFADRDVYLEKTRVVSELGAGFSSFSFLLGVFMLLLFIPLWVTSFDAVRKRMGQAKWKKLQRWSYVLYATLFIHAMGIQIGGMMNPRGGHAAPAKPPVEAVATSGQTQERQAATVQPQGGGQRSGQQTTAPKSSGRTPTKTLADFKPDAQTRRYIHLFSLILIYGSYLFLRVRKARLKSRSKE